MAAPGMPANAMVLAAGLGLRLRPITESRPKPLVELGGRTMLDRALDHIADAGIAHAVVNCHYLGDMIAAHIAGRERPRITLSRETELLDTGGGVARALGDLGAKAFFVVNADVVWTNGDHSAFARLARQWRDAMMDVLLLLHPVDEAVGYDGRGDFVRADDGRLSRRTGDDDAPYVFTGLQLLHPRLFADAPEGAFSLNLLYDRARQAGRLHGLVHDGNWYHVGTPEALAEAVAALGGA